MDYMNIPQHIAIIPDGNRRWAKKNSLPVFRGHRQGIKSIEEVIKCALDLKIPYLTFWGCSMSNILNRSKLEVNFLMKIFEQNFRKIVQNEDIHNKKAGIAVVGRWRELFPKKTKESIEKAIDATKNYQNYHLTFLMAYSGTDEMQTAIQNIIKLKTENINLKIDENVIKNNLWTNNLPPVDLVIRTGGEPHWSDGFMMWDVANAQLYFTETLWPDFSGKEFRKVVDRYSKTKRRMGK